MHILYLYPTPETLLLTITGLHPSIWETLKPMEDIFIAVNHKSQKKKNKKK